MYVCMYVQSTLPKLLRESLTYVGTKIKESKEKKTSQAFKLGNYSTCEFDLGRVNCMYVCVCVCVCVCIHVCLRNYQYAIGGRSSFPLRCHALLVHTDQCACAPILYISELCEDCTVAIEIDYA